MKAAKPYFEAFPTDEPVVRQVADNMCNMLDDIEEIADIAAAVKLSDSAKEAREHFRTGNLTAAELTFAKALRTDPGDNYSLYMLGCVLFERKKLHEAKRAFSLIVQREEHHQMALFLKELCSRRLGNKEESLLKAIDCVLDHSGPSEDVLLGWNDQMTKVFAGLHNGEPGGFLSVDQEKVSQILTNEKSANLILGATLLRPRSERMRSMEQREVKDSALYQAALLQLYTGESSKDLHKIKTTLEQLAKL